MQLSNHFKLFWRKKQEPQIPKLNLKNSNKFGKPFLKILYFIQGNPKNSKKVVKLDLRKGHLDQKHDIIYLTSILLIVQQNSDHLNYFLKNIKQLQNFFSTLKNSTFEKGIKDFYEGHLEQHYDRNFTPTLSLIQPFRNHFEKHSKIYERLKTTRIIPYKNPLSILRNLRNNPEKMVKSELYSSNLEHQLDMIYFILYVQCYEFYELNYLTSILLIVQLNSDHLNDVWKEIPFKNSKFKFIIDLYEGHLEQQYDMNYFTHTLPLTQPFRNHLENLWKGYQRLKETNLLLFKKFKLFSMNLRNILEKVVISELFCRNFKPQLDMIYFILYAECDEFYEPNVLVNSPTKSNRTIYRPVGLILLTYIKCCLHLNIKEPIIPNEPIESKVTIYNPNKNKTISKS